jgi:hypothetical protein
MKDEIVRRKKFRKILLKRIFVSADVKHTRRKFCTLKKHKHEIFGSGVFIQSKPVLELGRNKTTVSLGLILPFFCVCAE